MQDEQHSDEGSVCEMEKEPQLRERRRTNPPICCGDARGDEHLLHHLEDRAKDGPTKDLILAGIRQDCFCKMLGPEQLNAMVEAMQYFVFRAGETIVRQGDPGNYFFVVQDGSYQVSVDGAVANTFGSGTAFGGIALIYNCPRTATVSAMGDCGLWGVGGVIFRSVLKENSLKHHKVNWEFLHNLRILNGLSSVQKQRIAELAIFAESVEEGTRVITCGEAPTAVYFVKRGELSVMQGGHVDASGRLVEGTRLSQLRAGDFFGEHALLSGGAHCSSVVANSRCELVCIGVRQMREVLGEDLGPYLEMSFVRSIFKTLPVISHLSPMQHQQLSEGMKFKSYTGGESVESNLRLIIVLEGEVKSTKKGVRVTLTRGQCCQDINEGKMQRVNRADIISCTPDGLVAGPTGARLATLSRQDLARSMQELGLAEISGGDDHVIDYMKKMLLAKKVPVFNQLSSEQIDNLVTSLVLRKYNKGAKVFTQGEIGDSFHVITTGEVSVTASGKLVRVIRQGACFGERSLLFDEPRSATVEVSSQTAELWSLDREAFGQVVTESMRRELVHRTQLNDTDATLKTLRHVRLIGAGAFGSVRLVEDTRSAKRFALKRVKKQNGRVPEEVLRECALLEELDNPFVLRMAKTFETDTNIYILTELITGGQLHEEVHARMGLVGRKQAQFYIGTLVLICEYLHEHRIVYRDLKPENVILDAEGYVKLVDFGLAKKFDEGTWRTYTMLGTPLYIAPEILNGNGYGFEVDIWSLGVMMFELVCGCLPFGDGVDDTNEVLAAVIHDSFQFPTRYNDQAGKKLIQGMLCKEPENRLGAGINGWEDIKSAKFFQVGVTGNLFLQIAGREIVPPAVPTKEQYSNQDELDQTISLSDSEELCPPDRAMEKTLDAFRKFDIDGDGRIARWELAKILRLLDPITFTDAALNKLLDSADTDGDGYLSFPEFLNWISSGDSTAVRVAKLDIHI